MNTSPSYLELLVAEAMRRRPDLLHVFIKYHTGCVGCSMATFCTLQTAVEMHRLEETGFLQEIENTLGKPLERSEIESKTGGEGGETIGQ